MMTKLYTTLLFSLIFSFTAAISQQTKTTVTLPENVSESWFSDASVYIKQMEYGFRSSSSESFRVSNSANHSNFLITKHGYTAFAMSDKDNSEKWSVDFKLQSVGRNRKALSFSASSNFENQKTRLVQHFGFTDIEYLNNEKGLRQNFIVRQKPGSSGDLVITMQVQSSLETRVVNRAQLIAYTEGMDSDIKFIYEDLKVWDAEQRVLPSHMQLDEKTNILSLVVDDKDAVYPVTVDPLSKTPEWTTSANGILNSLLTNLSLQVNALYGYTVIGLGDVNNDGFDDVAVSAPGMADVLSGSGTLLSVGAVFIYKGGLLGLQATPDQVLQPDTEAGALFGFSMAAGNISPDGFNDLVIGAPLDSYTTSASALFGPVNLTVRAGKVYLYRSETLFASSNPSPFLDIHLNGTLHFSTGVLGLLASNVNVKALFGFSVAVTEDLNADGRQDLVIGSPAHLGTGLLDIQSGAAYVYYSDGLTIANPLQLDVPTPSILGLISLPVANLDGLLFGFSVEGVGNYNDDNFPDLAVGAPAGVDLSSLGGIFSGQVLGGSAYIYYGNGSGVNQTIGAKLQASTGSLLGNAANLFGYKIKAVKNVSDQRNGNILIGAPTGNVLSNILSGLRLKAGQVHVFKKKTAAFTSPVSSDQALSSPRSSSLLSLLTGQTLNLSLLYGASMDNLSDINCDGFADIIVGEPLSTNVPLIGANITGGAAYMYLGKADGSYQGMPSWSLNTSVSPLLGVNATSMLGFSVAGAGHTQGASEHIRAIVGGPTNALDFGSGLLNLGSTLGTLSSFAFDNNGLGKSYTFDMGLCGLVTLPTTLLSFSGRISEKTVLLNWATAMEPQVNMYELQRSADGANFRTIAMVFAKGGQQNAYNYTDKHPLTAANYYRLRIVDADSKFSYSNTIIVHFEQQLPGVMIAAPNPVKGDIKIRFSGITSGDYTLKLYNTEGRLMQVKKINLNTQEQTEVIRRGKNMPTGIYWVSVYNDNDKKIGTVRLLLNEQ